MRIHTVKEGDTVFKIARSYSVPPAKIIENNALIAPDRLYPGQKLIILTPTRTYTVRGGDTLDSIALRFGTNTEELQRNNPSLMGGDRIYPGQIIAVKYGEKTYGNAVVNGYFSKDCEKERLKLFLPYLTYVTLASHKWEMGELSRLFDYEAVLSLCKNDTALPIMRVFIACTLKELCEKKKEFCDTVTERAKHEGFSGVSLGGSVIKEAGFADFLSELKSVLRHSELQLHIELDGNGELQPYCELSKIADASLLNYEREKSSFLRDFNLCEGALLKSYAKSCEEEKTLVDAFSPAYFGDAPTDFEQIEKMIISRGISTDYCERAKTAGFKIRQYSGGKNTEISARFTSPENTKAKLELLGELGFMGVSFDIKRSPVSSLMCFNSLFKAEKAAQGGKNSCRDSG